jgi:hypothetical protein
MTAPLSPESEALLEMLRSEDPGDPMSRDAVAVRLARIEAAAIARYAEGLAREVRDRYCAMQHSGNKKPCGPDAHMGWVRALLAIPGAQEAQS